MELYKANKQWSTRPEDERFTSLDDLYTATKAYAESAREREGVALSTLRVENVNGDVELVGRGGVPAKLTHWSFAQLAARIGAPASYLRSLPATLAAQNLNHGLATKVANAADAVVNLLFHINGSYVLRALTSDRYERIWNYEVAERLLALQTRGWEPARPDIRVKDERLPLYASDHDLFAFIRSQQTLNEAGNVAGLQRGLIVENSEVGAGSLRLTRFLYREMCGNHIIWGAEQVKEISLRHVGNIRQRFSIWDAEIKAYLDTSGAADEARIAAAQRKRIAGTKDQVLDALFGKKIPGLSRKVLEAGYDAVVPAEDGDPRTVWGIVQGLTRHSQTSKFGDTRTEIDRAAGRLLDAF